MFFERLNSVKVILICGCLSALPGAHSSAQTFGKPTGAVVQRAGSRRGLFEVTPLFGVSVNNNAAQALAPMLSLAYHPRESIGLELMAGYMFSRTGDAVLDLANLQQLEIPPARRTLLQYFVGADVQWSPLIGKFRVTPHWMMSFHLYILGGLGLVGTQVPCEAGEEYSPDGGQVNSRFGAGVRGLSGMCPKDPLRAVLPGPVRFAGQWGIGTRWGFTPWLNLRLELRDIVHAEQVNEVFVAEESGASVARKRTSTAIRQHLFFNIGLSFLF